jgi:hypothetical protein
MQQKFCVAIDTQIATKSPFWSNSTPPIAAELVVLPKGFVAIGGKPCSVLKFTASLRVTWFLFHQGGSSLDLSIQGSEANH